MRLKRVEAILLRQFYLLKASPTRVVPLVAWVAVDMLLWGFFTRYLGQVLGGSFNFVSTILGAVLLWDFFTRVTFGITTAFLEDVWTKNFLNLFSAPLSVSEYVLGLVLTSIFTSSIGLVTMIALASGAFGFSFFSYGLLALPCFLVLFLFGMAFGIAGTALVLYAGPASEWMIWPIPALLSPFAGVFYPLATLPVWMQYLAYLLPPGYVFEALRQVVTNQSVSYSGLLAGFVLSCVYLLAACRIFILVYRHAIQSGLIARYSAESVS